MSREQFSNNIDQLSNNVAKLTVAEDGAGTIVKVEIKDLLNEEKIKVPERLTAIWIEHYGRYISESKPVRDLGNVILQLTERRNGRELIKIGNPIPAEEAQDYRLLLANDRGYIVVGQRTELAGRSTAIWIEHYGKYDAEKTPIEDLGNVILQLMECRNERELIKIGDPIPAEEAQDYRLLLANDRGYIVVPASDVQPVVLPSLGKSSWLFENDEELLKMFGAGAQKVEDIEPTDPMTLFGNHILAEGTLLGVKEYKWDSGISDSNPSYHKLQDFINRRKEKFSESCDKLAKLFVDPEDGKDLYRLDDLASVENFFLRTRAIPHLESSKREYLRMYQESFFGNLYLLTDETPGTAEFRRNVCRQEKLALSSLFGGLEEKPGLLLQLPNLSLNSVSLPQLSFATTVVREQVHQASQHSRLRSLAEEKMASFARSSTNAESVPASSNGGDSFPSEPGVTGTMFRKMPDGMMVVELENNFQWVLWISEGGLDDMAKLRVDRLKLGKLGQSQIAVQVHRCALPLGLSTDVVPPMFLYQYSGAKIWLYGLDAISPSYYTMYELFHADLFARSDANYWREMKLLSIVPFAVLDWSSYWSVLFAARKEQGGRDVPVTGNTMVTPQKGANRGKGTGDPKSGTAPASGNYGASRSSKSTRSVIANYELLQYLYQRFDLRVKVFSARRLNVADGEIVAIKACYDQPETSMREVRALTILSEAAARSCGGANSNASTVGKAIHPLAMHHIVPLLDTFYDAASCAVYMVFPLLQRLRLPPTVAEFVRYTRELFEAVCFMHQNGVVHGDLKPGNIMMVMQSSRSIPGSIMVVDFNSSVSGATESSWLPAGWGTRGHMPFEVDDEDGDGAPGLTVDVYCTGAIMGHFLRGLFRDFEALQTCRDGSVVYELYQYVCPKFGWFTELTELLFAMTVTGYPPTIFKARNWFEDWVRSLTPEILRLGVEELGSITKTELRDVNWQFVTAFKDHADINLVGNDSNEADKENLGISGADDVGQLETISNIVSA